MRRVTIYCIEKSYIIIIVYMLYNLHVPVYSMEKTNRNKWELLYSDDSVKVDEAVKIIIAGDIMLGRSITETCTRKNNFNYPFEKIIPYIKSDIFIGNLESPLTERVRRKQGIYMLKASVNFAPHLKFCNFTILSLANNHTLDAGPDGLEQCMEILTENSIYTVGAGENSVDALKGIDLNIHNFNLKIFAFNMIRDPEDKEDEYTDYCRAWLNDNSFKAINKAKSACDYIIVFIHWGEELEDEPDRSQLELGEKIIKSGADIIIGSHPHIMQKMDIITYNQRKHLIFYSLGNFIFDLYNSNDTRKSALFKIILAKEGVKSLYKLPINISRGQVLVENQE
jgi:poly-gamma-glutamate capsule biosynthesis protein CapA/YwtB (metallophosphatase superfamily)